MTLAAYLFVIVPLAIYIPMFLYETVISFRRIGKKGKDSAYLHATWEVTHTFLILGINFFVWLFSSIAPEVSRAVYWGLMTTGLLFITRAIFYAYLFYIKQNDKPAPLLDWIFALTHIGILAGLVYTVLRTIIVLTQNQYSINTQFIPWLWPGLVLMLALCALPLWQLYSSKKD